MTLQVPAQAIPQPVVDVCRHLRDGGHGAWVVGGSLRDLVLDVAVDDWDIATSARPQQVRRLFRRVIPTGIEHGTVTVLHGEHQFEVTTLRGETSYSDGRRPDHVYYVDDIEADLARRDFTVNAIAYDPLRGVTVDPFGGLDDLQRGLIRAVGDPVKRFREDGLRVLRAARFVSTLEFTLDAGTEEAVRPTLATFRKVSHERVRVEWLKALRAREPSRAFEVMRRTGILEVTLPELLEQVGCAQNRHHAHDVWTHSMHCVDAMRGDAIERLAALLHDLGKPRSRQRSERTGDYTFYGHEHLGADMASHWLHAYRYSNAERDKVVRMIRHHLIAYEPRWSDAAVRRFMRRVGTDLIDPLLRLARADAIAKGRAVDETMARLDELETRIRDQHTRRAPLTAKDLAVSGQDVMARLGIPPGRAVGHVLEALLERVLDDPGLNRRDALLNAVDEVGAEIQVPEGDPRKR